MSHILDLPVGEAIAEAIGHAPTPLIPVPNPLRSVLEDAYGRLAEAAATGRAMFSPAETALILEIANGAYRRGLEIGAAPVSSVDTTPPNILPFQN